MNYYAAREKLTTDGKPSGVWRYTCKNDSQIWPVGHCAGGCPGHPTPEEAEEHYRDYLLDSATFHGPKKEEWPKNKCSLPDCNTEATHCASTGPGNMRNHLFCTAHANREGLARIITSVGTAMSSC